MLKNVKKRQKTLKNVKKRELLLTQIPHQKGQCYQIGLQKLENGKNRVFAKFWWAPLGTKIEKDAR